MLAQRGVITGIAEHCRHRYRQVLQQLAEGGWLVHHARLQRRHAGAFHLVQGMEHAALLRRPRVIAEVVAVLEVYRFHQHLQFDVDVAVAAFVHVSSARRSASTPAAANTNATSRWAWPGNRWRQPPDRSEERR